MYIALNFPIWKQIIDVIKTADKNVAQNSIKLINDILYKCIVKKKISI